MKTIQPIRLFVAVLAGACLIAAPAEASSTNVNANADDLALYCSWEPDYACAPGSFTFTASATCGGETPVPPQDVSISASGAASGYTSGENQVTLNLNGVPPGAVDVTFSGAGEYYSATVYSLTVDIEQTREDYCIHGGSDTLDLKEDSYLGPSENSTAYWYWDATYKTSGCSYFFTESNPCGATVRAEAEKLPSCDDTCAVNIVKVDLAAEGCVCVTNGPGQTAVRKQITINKCEPADWDGGVELLWSAGNVEVYTASTGGDKVTSGTTFANTALPKTLWVEGTAPSQYAGDVIFRLNPVLDEHPCPNAADGCDQGAMTVVKVELIQTDNNSPLSPKNRMCSNAQDKYKNVQYKVNIAPDTFNANLTISGIASVRFDDLSTTKNVADGVVVTLTATDETKGSWILTADVSGCTDEVEEEVFIFLLEQTSENGLSEVNKATSSTWANWDYLQGANGLAGEAADGHYRDVWIITDTAGAYVGHTTVTICAYELSAEAAFKGPLAEVQLERNSLIWNALTSILSVNIPYTGLTLSAPATTSGGDAHAGVAMKISELAGDGPTSDGPAKIYVDSYGLLDYDASAQGALCVHVTTDRTFNLAAEPAETVRVGAGFAVGVSVNPGEHHKARARMGWFGGKMEISADDFCIVEGE